MAKPAALTLNLSAMEELVTLEGGFAMLMRILAAVLANSITDLDWSDLGEQTW